MKELRFAIVGAGFWARYQLAAWGEVKGARCVALCDMNKERAETLGRASDIAAIYSDAQEMLEKEKLDFLDIITGVEMHAPLVELAARHRLPVICQKPIASSLAEAERMVEACKAAAVPFLIHENWRWQAPIRELKSVLEENHIGKPFRARIDFVCSFPVFDNQPALKELEQFILTDIGSHILDVTRFLFGEARSLVCQTRRIRGDIRGEDVATVFLEMQSGMTVVCNLSYASRTEHERFPETFVFIEAVNGSAELGPDCWIKVTGESSTHAWRCPPPFYPWSDPRYALVQSSMVHCQRNLLACLSKECLAETSGEDNLCTSRLVFAAYQSAAGGGSVIQISN